MPFDGLNAPRAGDSLPPSEHQVTTVDLFAYSAVTWNKHPLHFDQEYARSRGYPNVLVHSHLHGAYLLKLVTDWAGDPAYVRSMSVSVRRPATPGDTLICRGQVESVSTEDGQWVVRLTLEEVRQSDGEVCAPATAVVALPALSA